MQLLLIDDDPIFRLGLRVFVEQFGDLQVVAEADRQSRALQILQSGQPAVDLAILNLDLGRIDSNRTSSLELCQQLKTQYPNLPILLLSTFPDAPSLAAARKAGVEGYCPKGTAVADLVSIIRQVAAGQSYWPEVGMVRQTSQIPSPPLPPPSRFSLWRNSPAGKLRDRIHQSSLRQIDAALAQVTAELQNAPPSSLDRAILAGRRRELRASRWLVEWFLAPRITTPVMFEAQQGNPGAEEQRTPEAEELYASPMSGSELSASTWQSILFDNTFAKIQYSVQNLTDITLEIDIFRSDKKRELLCLILRKLSEILDELRFSQVQSEQLSQKRTAILQDLWRGATTDFFGKYYTLQVGYQELEVVNVLLQDALIVQSAILDKIPLVVEWFDHLLFQTPLTIDNALYSPGTPEALARSEILMQNLVIQVANAVVQPLLNRFADVETIKQNFYDSRLISTREIERFRNNLSWRYRLRTYVYEPAEIFESRYVLLILNGRGIRNISIYAPRSQEIEKLSGVQQTVTLLLETRDAIAPRLRAVVAFVGKGVVYLLTQVVGRGIGLVGRGVIQGIGNSLQDNRFKNNSDRSK
jgi:DNA-binding NarL/FixJ family response regulator